MEWAVAQVVFAEEQHVKDSERDLGVLRGRGVRGLGGEDGLGPPQLARAGAVDELAVKDGARLHELRDQVVDVGHLRDRMPFTGAQERPGLGGGGERAPAVELD